jgi:hypothetical protein
MTPPSTLRTCAAVIGAALLAEVVVYLGVLFAYSIAGVQPAQQITCCELNAVPREAFDINGFALPASWAGLPRCFPQLIGAHDDHSNHLP